LLPVASTFWVWSKFPHELLNPGVADVESTGPSTTRGPEVGFYGGVNYAFGYGGASVSE